VQDTLLYALVESRGGGLVLRLGRGNVAGGEGLAHKAEAGTDAGTVGAIDFSLDDGLTGALERRNVICHE